MPILQQHQKDGSRFCLLCAQKDTSTLAGITLLVLTVIYYKSQ